MRLDLYNKSLMTGDCHVRPRKLSGLREAWGEIPLAYSTGDR